MEIRVQLLSLPERRFFACSDGVLGCSSFIHRGSPSIPDMPLSVLLWGYQVRCRLGVRHVWRQVVVSECADSYSRFGAGTNIARSRSA